MITSAVNFNVSLSNWSSGVVCTVSEMSNSKHVTNTAGANHSKSVTVLHVWWHCRCLAHSHSCFPVAMCILPIARLRSEWAISKAWVKIQYTEPKLCGNDPVVKNSIYSNSDLDLRSNDAKINRILPLPQDNHVAKCVKDPIYRTKVMVRKRPCCQKLYL